jgi:hypothetical protein
MAGQTKFTPEKLGQIRTLVESGKTRHEIADLLGVTVGSLQVTCSRLGISLRRIARRPADEIATSASGTTQRLKTVGVQQDSQSRPVKQDLVATPSQERMKAESAAAKFAVKMRYKGEERTTDLPFTQDMIRQLAFEAQLRDMRIGDFLGELFMATMTKDLFQRVLEPNQNHASKQAQTTSPTAKGSVPTAAPRKWSEPSA